MNDERRSRLLTFRQDALACVRCVEAGLLHRDERGCARPLLARQITGGLGIVVVGEAPNIDDTFDPGKGYLTYDAETDPTGRFMRSLLIDEAGLREEELSEVIFTNAVMCLPARQAGKHPVSTAQIEQCTSWLKRLLDESAATMVITMGATALRALRLIEPHRLELRTSAGIVHEWYGRKLLPLYHASRLGRISRPEAQQRQDIRPLRTHLGR
jgi:uracil-DNA glycosylase